MNSDATTTLVKTTNSPALARVSNQLALTEKLLTKPEEPFLIPYRRNNNSWFFCDKDQNIVIGGVCEYPKFSDEYKPVNWYIHCGSDWREREDVWQEENLTSTELRLLQNDSVLWMKLMVLNNTSEKTITLISTTDAIVRKGVMDGRETIIIRRKPGTLETVRSWWMRKPSEITVNIGDIVRVKAESDCIREIHPRD